MLSPALSGVLAARRSLLNQRAAQARQRWPGLDMAAFADFVVNTLDPLCVAVETVDAGATPMVAETGFELGLELVAQGLAGPKARLPWVNQAWRQLAPAVAPQLARAPLAVLGSLSNAVLRMDGVAGVRVAEWMAAMTPLAARCDDLPTLRTLGALCAWRAGMAHLREAALAQADTLPPALAAAALGVAEAQWPAARTRLQAERWWNPHTDAIDPQGQTLGGFSGLGGPFATPPELRAGSNGFFARSGERHYLLMADAFGAVVLPASAPEFAAASHIRVAAVALDAQGARVGGTRIAFAAPAVDLAAVSGPAGVALFSPWSHHVRVVPAAP